MGTLTHADGRTFEFTTISQGGQAVLLDGTLWVEGRIGDELSLGTESEPAPPRRITPLAFLNRFTDAEAIGIDLASQGATPQAAAVRRQREKITVASFIDLDRADTRAGVQMMEAAGLLDEGRALEILDAEIQPHEEPQ